MRRLSLLHPVVCATLLVGCLNPMTTRLPQLAPRDTRTELRSLARHDPFPDPDLGPDTLVRPRGFETERPEPRRLYEERLLQGQQPEFLRQSALPPAVGWRHPNVVH